MELFIKSMTELLEALVAWGYLEGLFEGKRRLLERIGLFFAFYTINFLVYMIPQPVPFFNVISYLAVNYLLIRICYGESWRMSFVQCTIMTATMAISELVATLLVGLYVEDIRLFMSNPCVDVWLIILDRLINFVLLSIEKIFWKKHIEKGETEDTKAWLFCIIPILSTLAVLSFSIVIAEGSLSREQGLVFVIFAFTMALGTFAIGYLYDFFS